MRFAWKPIRDGNAEDHAQLVDNFFSKYGDYIYKAEEFNIGPIMLQDFKDECLGAKHTCASLEGWHNEEFALFSDYLLQLLVNFLNRAERMRQWPSSLTIAKAALMHKGDPAHAGPLDLRILLILPALYRRWASTRLRMVSPWVGRWRLREMYAGPPGAGHVWPHFGDPDLDPFDQ